MLHLVHPRRRGGELLGSGLQFERGGALAACRVGSAVVVLARAAAGEPVRMAVGRYESD